MKYKAQLQVYEPVNLIYGCFAAEQAQLADIQNNSRLFLEVEDKQNHVQFNISAADPVAMRAGLNSITKGLTVINKMVMLK